MINEKYPGGIEAQKRLLENEGHKVVQKGRKFVVLDYEQKLVRMESAVNQGQSEKTDRNGSFDNNDNFMVKRRKNVSRVILREV